MQLEWLQKVFLIQALLQLILIILAFLNIGLILKLHHRSKSEPVSPIKTFAGCNLNTKNPKVAPITLLPNIETSGTLKVIPIITKHVIISELTLDDNPSIPSVKFIAFVVANITKIANGI